MTALACHSRIPILASGSDFNYIKVFATDGYTLQAFRNHDMLQGRRLLGLVSTLHFHSNAPLLAAGFANNIITIYAP